MGDLVSIPLTKDEINTIYEALKEFNTCVITDVHEKNIESILKKIMHL